MIEDRSSAPKVWSSSKIHSPSNSTRQTAPQSCLKPWSDWFEAARDVMTGARRHSHFEHTRSFASEQAAQDAFREAEERLEHPNRWSQLGHPLLGAHFRLFRQGQDQPEQVTPVTGDYIKIDLPDPGPPVWVKIESIDRTDHKLRMEVRPSHDPRRDNPDVIVHLFGEETTNIFELERSGNTVVSRVSGKNEIANNTGNVFQDLLAGIRLTGAWAGLKKPQWQAFVRNLLEDPPSRPDLCRPGLTTAASLALGAQQPDHLHF